MAQAERKAEVTWTGALTDGSGQLTVNSGAFPTIGLTWAARTEQPGGKTSPEELIAAAHASCYAMALSATLGRAGSLPEHLRVTSVVSLDPKEGGGFQIGASRLTVAGKVPGLDQGQFEELARKGEEGCPVSNALRGNVDIQLEATLE
jgi:lipoyl-dependent peroxiredoxin